MRYEDLSHAEVIISHEAKLSEIYETEVWDKSHIPWLVVGQVFYSIKRQFQAKSDIKEPGHGMCEFIKWPSANQNMTNVLEVEQQNLSGASV